MSYCLNPDCPKPQNPETHKFCQGCGLSLWLQERYCAIALIAQGGFGRTFLALDHGQSPVLPCVIKQLWSRNLSPAISKKATALFQQEIQQLEHLGKHPQIPTLLAHFEQNQQLYLVQEFIDGSNLAKIVEQEGIFNETQIWQLLEELLPVLTFLHAHQVIHRDIKPENIILRTSGAQGSQMVLVDFGAAKLVTDLDFFKTGTRIGSPEYVAPEQARGKAVFASDLYSLGVTCIHLLTGIPPFDLFDVVNDCWAWQDYLTQTISPELAQILDKLLACALNRRFQSVDEVMQAMQHVRKTEKVALTPNFTTPLPKPQNWQCRQTLITHSALNSVAISPDDSLLASSSDDKTIRVWSLETGEVSFTLSEHSQPIKCVAFHPDGTRLATGSDDKTIKLWDLTKRQEICTLSGHSQAVKSLAFSSSNDLLASGSWDKTIKVWNVQTGVEERTLIGQRLQVTSVAFSPCDRILASASFDRTVRLWDLSSDSFSTLKGHSRAVFTVAFSPTEEILATGGDDNTIILWDLNTQKALYTLLGHSWSVVAVAFSPDGTILISSSWDKTIKLWQVSTGTEIATLTGHLDSVSTVAMSSSGQIIASGSKDQMIKVWRQVDFYTL